MPAKMKVRKAVFPAAGLGTRFLPATKAMPKEMLPLVDKPIIQYGVEEALAAGCDQNIIITAGGNNTTKEHLFHNNYQQKNLQEKNNNHLLPTVRHNTSNIIHASVRQKEALG